VVGEFLQQLALVRHRRGHFGEPSRIDVDVAGGAGAHPAADGRDAILEFAQGLHDLETGTGLDFVLLSVAVGHDQLGHGRDPAGIGWGKAG
jgi:hypothetical protein